MFPQVWVFLPWTSLLSCPNPPVPSDQTSSHHLPFHLGHPGSGEVVGRLEKGPPSSHSTPWPPGVRLCPAGKKVLVSSHPRQPGLGDQGKMGRHLEVTSELGRLRDPEG